MDATEAILSRRSIRKYTSQPVPHELIDELLKAAMSAPSAGNEQPWHFVVINDHRILNEIPRFHPYSNMLREASVAVLVCGDPGEEKHGGILDSRLLSSHSEYSNRSSCERFGCGLARHSPSKRTY